jgi:hypothetical protein
MAAKRNSSGGCTPAQREEIRSLLTPELSALLHDDDVDRFTRARNNNVPNVVAMIQKWGEWWIMELPGDTTKKTPAEYVAYNDDINEATYAEYMPHSNLGHDKEGHPAYWEKTGDSK